MLDFLKFIRYLVFVVFIISNTVAASVAVWNLTIVEGSIRFSATATAAAIYLIVVAVLGLLLIFPILFLEILGKRTFLGVVWFELTWAGLFGMMTLIGASLITSLSSRELCLSPRVKNHIVTRPVVVSPCSSGQVLSVFTWMPATLLLAYMTLLSILAFVHSKEDPKIWKSSVRDLPVNEILGEVRRNSIVASLHQIRKTPVIHAPRPRHIIPPLLDCRSSRNSAYDFRPPVPLKSAPPVQENSWYQPSVGQGPYTSTALYSSSVQKVIESGNGTRMPTLPRPVQPGKGRRDQTSPPPLGDWPRMDATSRPRTKRYRSAPQTSTTVHQSSRRTAPPPPVSHNPERPTAPHRTSSSHSRSHSRTGPPGAGRSTSMDSHHRPPPLDLSKISTHLSRSERSQARAGR